MKLSNFIVISAICLVSLVSCGSEDEISGTSALKKSCESNNDCPLGYTCDLEKLLCSKGSGSGSENPDEDDPENGGNGGSEGGNGSNEGGNGGNEGGNGGNEGGNSGGCESTTGYYKPDDTETCGYQGPAGTENNAPCQASFRTCKEDGTWTICDGEVLPVYESDELCNDGIDNDCNGVADDGTDADGDGHGACTDCCETTEQCPDPKAAWDANNPDHVCTYEGINNECDADLAANSTDPKDYAKAIGICKTTTADSPDWGLISATITAPNGTSNAHSGSNALTSAFGKIIKPTSGQYMLALTSSKISGNASKITNLHQSGGTEFGKTGAPSDWYAANNNKFPAAESCPSSGTEGEVNDAVMLTLEIKTPKTAKSFSFNIYFLTAEYPQWICSKFNDFFIALLDSEYESDDENLQNPKDKNLAMDSTGNPVGINLAPAGLFTQCSPASGYEATKESCKSTAELQGTGFESHGGTGWLTTRGNVKGGEIIKLRLAIWDLGDHSYDSLVLIDNFKWDATAQKPGTGL